MSAVIEKLNGIYSLPMPNQRKNEVVGSTDGKIKRIMLFIFDKIRHFFHLVKLTFWPAYRLKCRSIAKDEPGKIDHIQPVTIPAVTEKIELIDDTHSRHHAAVTLQKMVRGTLARKKVSRYKDERTQLADLEKTLEKLTKKLAKKNDEFTGLSGEVTTGEKKVKDLENAIIDFQTAIAQLHYNESVLHHHLSCLNKMESLEAELSPKNRILSIFDSKKRPEIDSAEESKLTLQKQLLVSEKNVKQILPNGPLTQERLRQKLDQVQKESKDFDKLTKLQDKHKKHDSQCKSSLSKLGKVKKKIEKIENAINQNEESGKALRASLEKIWEEITLMSAVPKKFEVPPPHPVKDQKKEKEQLPENPGIDRLTPPVPVQKEAPPVSVKKIAADSISSYINPDMGTLFSLLFSKFPEESMTSWSCDQDGSFKLTLSKKVHIWVPCKDNRIKGGVVMEFGNDAGIVDGKLDRNTGKLCFNSGFKNLCIAKIGFFTKQVESKMLQMEYHSKDSIDFTAHYLYPEVSKNSLASLTEDWGPCSESVLTSPWEHIKNKIK